MTATPEPSSQRVGAHGRIPLVAGIVVLILAGAVLLLVVRPGRLPTSVYSVTGISLILMAAAEIVARLRFNRSPFRIQRFAGITIASLFLMGSGVFLLGTPTPHVAAAWVLAGGIGLYHIGAVLEWWTNRKAARGT